VEGSVEELRKRDGAVTSRPLAAKRDTAVESVAAMQAWMDSYDVSMEADRVVVLTGQPSHLNPGVLDV
jgi:hypothetical protein